MTESLNFLKGTLPFILAFLASRFLIYPWVNNVGFQSPGFSPTVASILSAPILAAVHFCSLGVDTIHNTIEGTLTLIITSILLFSPTFLVLSPLLVIYLVRSFQQKPTSNVLLFAATVCCSALQFMWAVFLLDERRSFW